MDEQSAVADERAASGSAAAGINAGMNTATGSGSAALVVRDRPPVLYQPSPVPQPGPGQFDPLAGGIDTLRLLHALRRRWLPAAVLGLLAAFLCAVPVWAFMPRGYEAVVWLRVRDKGGMLSQERDTAEYEAYKKTQLQLMKSPNVLQAALRKPGIEQLETLQESGLDQIGWLARSLVVTAVPESEVVQVRLRGKKPDEVAKILNAVTNAFLDDVVNKERTERLGRRDALEKKFKENMTELRNRRDVLNNLARTLGTRDSAEVANQRALLMDHVATLRGLVVQTQRDIAAIDAELWISDAKDRGEIAPEDSVSDEVMDAALVADPQIAELSARLAATDEAIAFQQQRSARGGSEPAVRRLRAQAEELRQRIDQRKRELRPAVASRVLSDSAIGRVESPIVLRKRREMLAKTLADTSLEFDKLSKEATELGKANADMDARKVELEHLQRVTDQIGIELESTAIDLNMPNRVTLIEPASVPHSGDRVLRVLVTLLAGLAGLVLAGGGVVMQEYLKDHVSAADDMSRRVGVRVLGGYPLVTLLRRRTDQAELMAERSDTLRALLLQSGREPPRVILVTSAVEGEGKTTVATQLAASLARSDRRTLLIDGDLRHPTAHVPLELEMRTGFPELLRGEIGNDEAVQPTTIDGLFAVTGGAYDYAAITALARPDLARILKGYRDAFDHVIIDSSPVLEVSDALMLAQQSDVVVLSTMLDVSRVPLVNGAVDRLRSVGARLLGAVVHGGGAPTSRRRATQQLRA